MILHEITLNLETIKSATLLLETKLSVLKGSLSPNTILAIKCVLGIWVLIIAGNLIAGFFGVFSKIAWRSRKMKHYEDVAKDECHLL